ncbi:uncharacterized protein C8Q71DRAFT_764692 [Rhodofomes roseus]|uniref:Uncharacterized protein n=1 Tax=Rhodofomes roseus TaxID=34475 RepID=A0ABQ8KCF8_9APHY|nr:uncharacterized protein C8Q71DRAFT_764692 [Rhodofomes roseus]KAH9835212.1 hypothetical protein C8Q71DRAFT_764692 [Rhodofomes roseus]
MVGRTPGRVDVMDLDRVVAVRVVGAVGRGGLARGAVVRVKGRDTRTARVLQRDEAGVVTAVHVGIPGRGGRLDGLLTLAADALCRGRATGASEASVVGFEAAGTWPHAAGGVGEGRRRERGKGRAGVVVGWVGGRVAGRGACGVDGDEDELAAAVRDDAGEGHAGVGSTDLDGVEVVVELRPGVLDDAETRLCVVAGDLCAFDACLGIEDRRLDGSVGERMGLATGRGGMGGSRRASLGSSRLVVPVMHRACTPP